MTEPAEFPIDIAPAIKQRLARDIIPCTEIDGLWEVLELVPPGEEVAESSHQEHHARMNTVAPFAPMGEIYISFTAEIISRVMLASLKEKHPDAVFDPHAFETLLTNNTEVIRGSLYPILAHLMEAGVVTYGPTVTGIGV